MSLRTRLLVAFAAVVLIPIVLLALGLRQEMTDRLSNEYERRVASVVQVIDGDLRRESTAISAQLASLVSALLSDNRFRLGAVADVESEHRYVLDYAGTAMRLTGLSMLQIHDDDGRIISSGHFRNEHGRLQPELPDTLATVDDGVAIITARSAAGEFVALARHQSFEIGDRSFTLVGGVTVDRPFLTRLARDREITLSLVYPGGRLSTHTDSDAETDDSGEATPDIVDAADAVVRSLPIALITTMTTPPSPTPTRGVGRGSLDVVEAQLLVTHPLTPLHSLLRSVDSWFLLTAVGTGVTAMLLAVWVSSRISRPLTELADKTAVLDLDRLDVDFDTGKDEVGTLAQVLGDLASRLRASTRRVRDAERRAAVGDLARQINHDIKNGLIPLRNVFRHLAQVGTDSPGALPVVFDERRSTVDSSIAYLETLATNYERLSRRPERAACDINALVYDVVRGAREQEHVELRTHLSPGLAPVIGDAVSLRRILDNLIANAVDSLEAKPGSVTVTTELVQPGVEPPALRVTVTDTGRGITKEETPKIFSDFYTTKEDGTGLGLSIVRRLVLDLQGTLRVESEPGAGTAIIMEIPAGGAAHES